ncbi:MAG: ATP:cob(I)alamin adenosyltransferase, partial [Sphingobacteriaceae bacterium]
ITIQLSENSFVEEKVKIYLNRLSDYLFMLARKIGYEQNIAENNWIPRN